MIRNPPGRFAFGMTGPHGHAGAFGRWLEPDLFPLYDFLDEPPTSAELTAFAQHRLSLPINVSNGYAKVTGGYCHPAGGGGGLYKMDLVRHAISFGGQWYYHYCLVRHPRDGASSPPTGEYPILLQLHGRHAGAWDDLDEIFGGWTNWLEPTNDFYTDQCVVVWPLYFGTILQLPYPSISLETPAYDPDCEIALDLVSIPLFNGQRPRTKALDDDIFQANYASDGYTTGDVQIIAVLQSLKTVLNNAGDLGLSLNGDVGTLSMSMGTNIFYDIAPIMHYTGNPGTLKVCVALYGGTDQYAPFNVRRSKKYLASSIQRKKYFPGSGFQFERIYPYSDILDNQIARTLSCGSMLYMWMQDPDLPEPPVPPCVIPGTLPELSVLKAQLRYWFLEESVARWWLYGSGPYPLQVHHGTDDDTVSVLNSRWLAQQMRNHEVAFDDSHFKYFETNFGTHEPSGLSQASRDAMAEVLHTELGW